MSKDNHDAFRRRVLENIRTHGFHMTAVLPDDENDKEPGFTYTVGLETTFSHPELLIVGIGSEAAARLLHAAVDRIRNGETLATGLKYDKIAKDYDMAIASVPDDVARKWCLGSYRFQPDVASRVRVLQLVWPDTGNRFPWDPDFEVKYQPLQPILARPT